MAGFRYFTLKELIATNKGVDNTPTWEVVEHLAELTEKILEPLRAAYFKKFVREWFLKTRPAFDQCIIERKGKTEWVHIGLYNQAGWQRGMLFQLNVYETR